MLASKYSAMTLATAAKIPLIRQGGTMLVLTRRINETLLIGPDITMVVLDIKGNKIRLGIVAPDEMPIRRQEGLDKIDLATTNSYPRSSQ